MATHHNIDKHLFLLLERTTISGSLVSRVLRLGREGASSTAAAAAVESTLAFEDCGRKELLTGCRTVGKVAAANWVVGLMEDDATVQSFFDRLEKGRPPLLATRVATTREEGVIMLIGVCLVFDCNAS